MRLGRSQKAVLDYITTNQRKTAREIGAALYEEHSSCARFIHYGKDGTATSWASRLLRSLEKKGLARRVSNVKGVAVWEQADCSEKEKRE